MSDSVTGKLNRGSRRYSLKTLSSAPIQSNIVTDNLVLYLDAGNSASYPGAGTDWYDLTSNNHDCTLVNGPVYSSNNGGYFDFDGVYDYGIISNHSDFYFGTEDFTIEMWAMTENINEQYQVLCGNHNGGVGGGWFFYGDDGGDKMAFGNTTQVDDTVHTQSQDTWYHFVIRRSSGTVDFFRNNTIGSNGLSFNDNITDTNNLDLIIGQTYYYSTLGTYDVYGWNGRIAQVRIYKGKALSNSEISQNYNADKSRYGL